MGLCDECLSENFFFKKDRKMKGTKEGKKIKAVENGAWGVRI